MRGNEKETADVISLTDEEKYFLDISTTGGFLEKLQSLS
jgi:hypothetical protein